MLTADFTYDDCKIMGSNKVPSPFVRGAEGEVGGLEIMADYYAHDIAIIPYAEIIKGKDFKWPLSVRLIVVIRKFMSDLGWKMRAGCAHGFPAKVNPTNLDDLPQTMQAGFQKRISEAESFGFQMIVLNKTDTIGNQVRYGCHLVNQNRDTLWNIGFLKTQLGSLSKSAWVNSLRTDLQDGTILLSVQAQMLPKYLLQPHQKIEFLSENESNDNLLAYHQDRLAKIPHGQILYIPEYDIIKFLIEQSNKDFSDLLATGMLRKITPKEIDRLKRIQIDLE
jgi:hypothetical protein